MTAVHFTLKTNLRQRLDLSPLTPDALASLDPPQIAAIELLYGNARIPVGDLFRVTVHPNGNGIVFDAGDERFDRLGQDMSSGSIHVSGDAGWYLGHRMRGGTITVDGSAGSFCGAEIKGGELRVRGKVGDFAGAALPGNKHGMSGGLLVIGGSAGDRVGDHMRRGLILIEGDAGAYLASRMTAGTIAVQGQVGRYPGYGMKRGTVLLVASPASLPVTFNDCGVHTLGFLPLLLRSSSVAGTPFAALAAQTLRVRRYAGDLAGVGKGEILVLMPPG